MIRGLTAFKVLAGTRYYVRLVLASLNSIKYFLAIFFYSTFFFSVIIAIAQNCEFNFYTLWEQSWNLNFGADIDENKNNSTLVYVTVALAKIVNVVLMLNMLISILGDSYDNFLLEKHIIDYREKLEAVIEIQKMMYFKRGEAMKKYFHFLMAPYEDNDGLEDWQGKILYMEKRQERKMQQLGEKIAEFERSNKGLIDQVSKEISEVKNSIRIEVAAVEKESLELNLRLKSLIAI